MLQHCYARSTAGRRRCHRSVRSMRWPPLQNRWCCRIATGCSCRRRRRCRRRWRRRHLLSPLDSMLMMLPLRHNEIDHEQHKQQICWLEHHRHSATSRQEGARERCATPRPPSAPALAAARRARARRNGQSTRRRGALQRRGQCLHGRAELRGRIKMVLASDRKFAKGWRTLFQPFVAFLRLQLPARAPQTRTRRCAGGRRGQKATFDGRKR